MEPQPQPQPIYVLGVDISISTKRGLEWIRMYVRFLPTPDDWRCRMYFHNASRGTLHQLVKELDRTWVANNRCKLVVIPAEVVDG